MTDVIQCDDLDDAIERYVNELGYRLDMICPADAPREALLSRGAETMGLILKNYPVDRKRLTPLLRKERRQEWVTGRAGMEYRDLIPHRLGGKVIASHIRLSKGGEVPDYVHYHKVDFQMIYCKRGRIKVVYEDQGPPFWLDTGDCVLQPPEIRHRVLECTAGAEVIEIGMPAVHETWVEHEIELPTAGLKPDRVWSSSFGWHYPDEGPTKVGTPYAYGQRFVRFIRGETRVSTSVSPGGFNVIDTGINEATVGLVDVCVLGLRSGEELPANYAKVRELLFCFVLRGKVVVAIDGKSEMKFSAEDSFVVRSGKEYSIRSMADTEILTVSLA